MSKLEELIEELNEEMTDIISKAYRKGYEDGIKVNNLGNFKVGDKVRTIEDKDVNGTELFPIGTIGTIVEINDENEFFTYLVKANSDWWWYSRDMLEVVESEE